jgi:RimJ/RimL family protein N-acetyltransferase
VSFEREAWGLWLMREKESGELVGFAGLVDSRHAAPSFIVGVALEASARILRHAFEDLRSPEIRADVDEPNTASVRLLERLGFRLEVRREVEGRPLRDYRLHAPARTGGPGPAGGRQTPTA